MSSSLPERAGRGPPTTSTGPHNTTSEMPGDDGDAAELPGPEPAADASPVLPDDDDEHDDDGHDDDGHDDGHDDNDDAQTIRDDEADEADGRDSPSTTDLGLGIRYRNLLAEQTDSASDDGSALGLPRRPGSPGAESIVSMADSTASAASAASAAHSNRNSMVSSLGGSGVFPASSLARMARSASPSFRPFDQRFQSRIASGGSGVASPASRHRSTSSLSSPYAHGDGLATATTTDASSPPWEVVRWTKLTKLSSQSFSESARRNFGSPTCMAISASIVLGTTKGILLVFDYNQNLKLIIGPGTKAVEAGAVRSVAISADHTTVAGGHDDGSLFTWELSRAARPFLHIPPLDAAQAPSAGRTVDGHRPGSAVTHLGFLGTRRTALVSADDRGMAFAHLATRGTGSLGRTVRTSRILGRYPVHSGSRAPASLASLASGKPVKPSTVLAFAPLPLGNVDRATDSMGLTAMLTPYLLVIVSTTPVANTQHKSPRPKEVAPHSAMSGCLAWFPAVRLKVPDARTGEAVAPAKLAYCWSNVLTVLDVHEEAGEDGDKAPAPALRCQARSRWTCEEAVVAVQWLTRSVLAVLTISQRLIVLEDRSMRVTEAFDLMSRHIFHADLFSRQLQQVVETLDEADPSLHGVVADAFAMSFKAYKGRLFLLGFNDVAIGALSNWADRLIALMEHGDYVGAIRLATSFYTGDADKLTIGLPEDAATRHAMVQERLMEIMAASLKYAFTRRRDANPSDITELATTCFAACASVGDTDFLFNVMYDWFDEAGAAGVFFETLEPYILDATVTAVPPTVVQALVRHYVGRGLEGRLEELLCHMDTATLDLDQTTALCRQHGLYDALAYVWTVALHDVVTPLVELLALLVPHMTTGEYAPPAAGGTHDGHDTSALKLFPYLSYVLTGRVYPTGAPMDEAVAQEAKAELYWFLFCGQSVAWPRGSTTVFRTRPGQSQEPSFPYLRMILKFHAPSFLSALNEAFEDPFLNDAATKPLVPGLPEEQVFGRSVDRQYMVSILLELMGTGDTADTAFAPHDTIYLDMFVARNLPKYPQYLLLPESTLTQVLTRLCQYPGADLAEDAQLSAEYLLSVYRPPNMAELLPLFRAAGFFRILKQTYRSDGQYAQLVAVYFDDPDDRRGVFACIGACLAAAAAGDGSVARRQRAAVLAVVEAHALDLLELDAAAAARVLDVHAPALHAHCLAVAHEQPLLQYTYLRTLLEDMDGASSASTSTDLVEQYIRLMCTFDAGRVAAYVGTVPSADLHLGALLPTMEDTGVVDAAVVLLANDGQRAAAMDRLVQHLHTLAAGVEGLLSVDADDADDVSDASNTSDATVVQRGAEEVLRSLQKYTHVGIWLCQEGAKAEPRERDRESRRPDDLSADEALWLELIDATVAITRSLSSHILGDKSGAEKVDKADAKGLVTLLRSLVQHTFTALLTTTTTPATTTATTTTTTERTERRSAVAGAGSNLSFLRILKAFLARAAVASPSVADLRAVLASIFAAYAYEEAMLRLAGRLLERSLFGRVQAAVERRQRGWRSKGALCEACGRRVWGPGAAADSQTSIYDAWEARQAAVAEARADKAKAAVAQRGGSVDRGKGKSRADARRVLSVPGPAGRTPSPQPAASTTAPSAPSTLSTPTPLGPLVLFACRHVYHQACLDALETTPAGTALRVHPEQRHGSRAYVCPIDGE